MSTSEKVTFTGHGGHLLDARLEKPAGKPRAYALFAHCFSCSKNSLAATRIARHLTDHRIAVLRFDFTGLGASEGDFANTNFTSNVQDLIAAAKYMEETYGAADLLIGHSLGGAAALVAANQLPNVKAVATIGAPADAGHVLQHMAHHLEDIETKGQAEVQIAGRAFTIKDQFVSDVREAKVLQAAEKLKRPLLILHAPTDETVGVNNATELFMAARHPKSFVSLDKADHLLTGAEDTEFAADVIAAWAERYVATPAPLAPEPTGENHLVNVSETVEGAYANFVATEYHVLRADEPERLGGINTGPAPYEYLSAALGACTSITLRMYLERKGWPVEHISVNVKHRKSDEADANGWKPDIFTRELNVRGNLTEDQRGRLVEIANKCPVHKTLHRSAVIETELGSGT